MFVYDMGIVDFYTGMTKLKDYVALSLHKNAHFVSNLDMAPDYLSYTDLLHFLTKCFFATKCNDTWWEGDIRSLNEIAIGALPRVSGMTPYKFIVFKQDNNGSSFLVSECDVGNYDKENRYKMFCPRPKIDPLNLIEMFEDAYDFAFQLINDCIKKCDCLNHKEDSEKKDKVKILAPSSGVVDLRNIKESNTTDHFNMDNYVKA